MVGHAADLRAVAERLALPGVRRHDRGAPGRSDDAQALDRIALVERGTLLMMLRRTAFLSALLLAGCSQAGPSAAPILEQGDTPAQPPPASVSEDAGAPPILQLPDAAPPTPFDGSVPTPPPIPVSHPIFGATIIQPVAPPPLSGGTLRLGNDGQHAFASDPDRDAFYSVDLVHLSSTEVALQAGDEPGRLVEDAAARMHVVLRGAGAVATIDAVKGAVLWRRPVCARPRGIDYDAASDTVLVACAGGQLVTLPAGGGAATRTVQVEPDLRDVVVLGGKVYVSEFRSAAVLQLAADGTIASRLTGLSSLNGAGVAWRMIGTPSGQLALTAQLARTEPITPAPGAYGSGGCGGSVSNAVAVVLNVDGTLATMNMLPGALPVDIAAAPVGAALSVVLPAEWRMPGSLQLANTAVPLGVGGPLPSPPPPLRPVHVNGPVGGPPPPPPPPVDPPINCGFAASVTGQAIAVAYDPNGRVLVQTREPAQLWIDPGFATATVPLSTVSRDDTGHEIFHSDQGGGIACASCHAEGGDDGRAWSFAGAGLRRTPSCLGTLKGTAPYHWDGSQADLPALYQGAMERMNGADLQQDQVGAFTSWLQALPGPRPEPGDSAAIARGQALFSGAGACSSCHSGPMFTNNETLDIGNGAFQVPPLVGVAARAPFLHDGCAATLTDAIGGCGHASTHGTTASFTSAQIGDLAAYLQSL